MSSNPGSGSGIRIRNWKKCWIRFRIRIRILNPYLGFGGGGGYEKTVRHLQFPQMHASGSVRRATEPSSGSSSSSEVLSSSAPPCTSGASACQGCHTGSAQLGFFKYSLGSSSSSDIAANNQVSENVRRSITFTFSHNSIH
jgi:hypothetical protein